MFTWTSILTINGKPLTQNFTKITMEEVRAHAQVYQDRKKNKEFIYRYLSKAKAIVTSRSRVLGFGLVTQSIKVRWRLMSHYNPSFQLFSDLVLLRGGQVAAEIQTPKGFLWDAVVHDSFLTCYATAFSW